MRFFDSDFYSWNQCKVCRKSILFQFSRGFSSIFNPKSTSSKHTIFFLLFGEKLLLHMTTASNALFFSLFPNLRWIFSTNSVHNMSKENCAQVKLFSVSEICDCVCWWWKPNKHFHMKKCYWRGWKSMGQFRDWQKNGQLINYSASDLHYKNWFILFIKLSLAFVKNKSFNWDKENYLYWAVVPDFRKISWKNHFFSHKNEHTYHF